MSIVRLFTDAATGALGPQTIAPAGSVPSTTPTPAKLPQPNEDAAVVTLSTAAKEFAATSTDATAAQQAETGPNASGNPEAAQASETNAQTPSVDSESSNTEQDPGEQSAEDAAREREQRAAEQAEEREIRELQARDREVRAHEQAHLNALGPYARGGASYTYTTGPDGKQYATGGEVPVDVSPEGTPEETIQKAQTVRRAALAPAEPSGADRAVAAQASQLEQQARAELQRERTEGGESIDGVAASESTPSVDGSESSNSPEAGESSAAEEATADFFSGRLVGGSPQAFQSSAAYAGASSARGGLLDVNA